MVLVYFGVLSLMKRGSNKSDNEKVSAKHGSGHKIGSAKLTLDVASQIADFAISIGRNKKMMPLTVAVDIMCCVFLLAQKCEN